VFSAGPKFSSGDLVNTRVLRWGLFAVAVVPIIQTVIAPDRFQSSAHGDLAALQAIVTPTGQSALAALPTASALVLFAVAVAAVPVLLVQRAVLLLPSFLLAVAIVLSSVTHREIPKIGALAPALFLALAVAFAWDDPQGALRTCFRVVKVYLIGSWAAAVIMPTLAVEINYQTSLFASLPYRLHGIAPHANSLGAIAATAVLLAAGTRARLISFVLPVTTLVATQSKTSMLAVAGAMTVFGLARAGRHVIMWLVLAVQIVAIPALVWLAHANNGLENPLGPLGDLTGRTRIWEVSLVELSSSQVFGLGRHFWDYSMRVEYLPLLGFAPGQAHNQLLQSVGQYGIFGLVGAIGFFAFLLVNSWRTTDVRLRAAGLGMVSIALTRSVTETTIPDSLLEVNATLMLVMVVVACQKSCGECDERELPAKSGSRAVVVARDLSHGPSSKFIR
jgi:O-antigen ligase